MKEYIEIEEEILKTLVDTRRGNQEHGKRENFLSLLNELKRFNNMEISTEFLKQRLKDKFPLISEKKINQKITNFIRENCIGLIEAKYRKGNTEFMFMGEHGSFPYDISLDFFNMEKRD